MALDDRGVNKAATIIAFGFVGLNTIFMLALPLACFYLFLGRVAGSILTTLWVLTCGSSS